MSDVMTRVAEMAWRAWHPCSVCNAPCSLLLFGSLCTVHHPDGRVEHFCREHEPLAWDEESEGC